MELDIKPADGGDLITVENVDSFEVGSVSVFVYRLEGENETIEGEVIGGGS